MVEFTFTPPYFFMAWCLILSYLYLLLPTYIMSSKYWNTIKLSLCLIKHQVMKTYWGWRFTQAFLTSVLDGGKSSASRPGRLTSRERTLLSTGYCLYPRSWPGRWGEDSLFLSRIEPKFCGRPVCDVVVVLSQVSQLILKHNPNAEQQQHLWAVGPGSWRTNNIEESCSSKLVVTQALMKFPETYETQGSFTLHIPSWAPLIYDFVVLTSLTHPRKIIFCAVNGKIGNSKSQRLISTPT
jgi:hypothetical protein